MNEQVATVDSNTSLITPTSYDSLGLDKLLKIIKAQTQKINALNVDDLLEDGIIGKEKLKGYQSSIFTQNIQIYKNYPSVIFNPSVTGDTDWYATVANDGDGTSNDNFIIGIGTTPGTTPIMTLDPSGNVYFPASASYTSAPQIYMNEGKFWWNISSGIFVQMGMGTVIGSNINWALSATPINGGINWNLIRYLGEGASAAVKELLAFCSDGNIDPIFGSDTKFSNLANLVQFYYGMVIESTRKIYFSHGAYPGTAFIAAQLERSGATPTYVSFGDTTTGAGAVGLKLYGGAATSRFTIESDGTVKIPTFTVAGMVKNLADGSLVSGGTVLNTIAIKTNDYIVTSADGIIICNKATAMTITLPAATGSGAAYTIKNINTGTVTVDGNSSDTIDSETTQLVYQWESITVIDYAANAWVII